MVTTPKLTPAKEPQDRNSDPRIQSGFQLASLALLITVAGCLLACIDMRLAHKQNSNLRAQGMPVMLGLFGGVALFGSVVGFVYAIIRRSGWRLFAIAPLMGAFASFSGGLIMFAPAAIWQTSMAVSVLLIATVCFRWNAD